jgi:8-oxo-dGTP pyrophosphatase MutT (NUDIX family)
MDVVHRDCVVGLIMTSDGKILLGKKDPRRGGVYPECWHLPGGGIEPGESQQEALRREIKEETGIDILPFQKDFLDGSGYGEAEKFDRAAGKTVLCRMNFYTYRIYLPATAAQISINLEDREFMQTAWASIPELANYWLTPPSVTLFTRLGYM